MYYNTVYIHGREQFCSKFIFCAKIRGKSSVRVEWNGKKTAAQNDAVLRSGKEVRDVSKNRTQTQNKKREKELQQQKEQERQEKLNKIIKVGLPIAALLAVFIYIKYRAYIGYYIALFAIPYGVYGLFKPYHSAAELCQQRLCRYLFPPAWLPDSLAGYPSHLLQCTVRFPESEYMVSGGTASLHGAVLSGLVSAAKTVHS